MATGPGSVTVQLVMLLGDSWRRFDRSAVRQILLQSRVEVFFFCNFIHPYVFAQSSPAPPSRF